MSSSIKGCVLVTGGAGFIGTHTIVELLQSSWSVVCVDNYVNGSAVALERVKQIVGEEGSKQLTIVDADVCDSSKMRAVFERRQSEANAPFDCVIHFAGLKAVGESIKLPLLYYENNLLSTIVLMKLMKEFSARMIIFSSSATVYGNVVEDGTLPKVETQQYLDPTNAYGRTKFFIEEMLKDSCVADPEFNAVILRYFNPVGAHPSGLIGEDPSGIPNNLMPYVLQVASGKLEQVQVFGNDYETSDGTGARDYIHVVDLAKGHLAALEKLRGHKGREIINLGTGKGTTVLELIAGVSKACGFEIPYKIVGRRAGDIATVVAAADRAGEILGWSTAYTVTDACEHGWNWQKNNPNGFSSN